MKCWIFLLTCGAALWPQDVVDFDLMRGLIVVNRVRVNGEGPFRFLLDTGAQSCAIAPALAQRLALRPQFRTLLSTAGGESWAGAVPARLAIGTLEAGDVEMLIFDASGFDGVIGQSFLSRFNYVIDYDERRLVFEPGGGRLRGSRMPYDLADGRIRIPGSTPHGNVRLVLDSGASEVVLYGGSFNGELRPLLQSHLGSIAAGASRLEWLKIGDVLLARVQAAIVPLDSRAGLHEDGLLPTRLFHSIYVNNRERFIVLDGPPH